MLLACSPRSSGSAGDFADFVRLELQEKPAARCRLSGFESGCPSWQNWKGGETPVSSIKSSFCFGKFTVGFTDSKSAASAKKKFAVLFPFSLVLGAPFLFLCVLACVYSTCTCVVSAYYIIL